MIESTMQRLNKLGIFLCWGALFITLPTTCWSFEFPEVRDALINVYNKTTTLQFLPTNLTPEQFISAIQARELALRKIREEFAQANHEALDYQNRVVNTLPTTNLNGQFALGLQVSILGQLRESVEIKIRLLETDLLNSRNLTYLESFRESQKQSLLLAAKLKEITAEILKVDNSNVAIQKNMLNLAQMNSQISNDILQAAKTTNQLEHSILRINAAINDTAARVEQLNSQSLVTQKDMLAELIGGSWISKWGLIIAFVSLLLTAMTSIWSLCLQIRERAARK